MGLMVSRALGDGYLKSYGVNAEPDVFQHKLEAEDRCAIVASDGVWEMLSDEQVAQIAYEHRESAASAATAIVAEARAKWDNEASLTLDRLLKFYRDDITATVLMLPSIGMAARLQLMPDCDSSFAQGRGSDTGAAAVPMAS